MKTQESRLQEIKVELDMEISITEALCIFNSGWRTPIEKELFDQSYNVIREEARRLHLIYQKQSIDKELKDLTKK